jgi:hypothetical protein
LRKTILSLSVLSQSNRVYWYSFVVLGYLLGRLGRQESLPYIMWEQAFLPAHFSHKRAQGTQRKIILLIILPKNSCI